MFKYYFAGSRAAEENLLALLGFLGRETQATSVASAENAGIHSFV